MTSSAATAISIYSRAVLKDEVPSESEDGEDDEDACEAFEAELSAC